MKKSMILAGMLAIGYANAQTENYEGRVGVNTETPSATLNVKSKTGTDASTKALEVENANGTKMVTILDNGRVGIGTDAPEYALDVQTSGSHPDRLKDYAYGSMRLLRYRDAGSMGLDFYRARGTKEAPLPIQKGDGIGSFAAYGYIGDKFVTAGSVGFSVGDTPTSDNVIPMQYDISFRNQASGGNMRNGYNSVFRITPVGNIGIGILEPSEKLHIDGNIRAKGLAGIGNRNVYVDADGVLQAGEATTTGATTLTGETNLECNADNRGKMNFIQGADGKSDVFGICMKNKDGNYYWGYMVGGNNPTNGTGTFGSGL